MTARQIHEALKKGGNVNKYLKRARALCRKQGVEYRKFKEFFRLDNQDTTVNSKIIWAMRFDRKWIWDAITQIFYRCGDPDAKETIKRH
jgi:hypothetical protein